MRYILTKYKLNMIFFMFINSYLFQENLSRRTDNVQK